MREKLRPWIAAMFCADQARGRCLLVLFANLFLCRRRFPVDDSKRKSGSPKKDRRIVIGISRQDYSETDINLTSKRLTHLNRPIPGLWL